MSTCLRLFSLTIRAALALLFFGSVNAYAATFYVAPTGKDTNPGTPAAPWLTIQRAANVVNPGDTVVVQPSTYKGAKFSRSGLATAHIRFVGQPGALVNSPGPLNSNGDNLWIRNAHYILLEGFTVTNAPQSGIAIQGEPTAPAIGNLVYRNHCHHNGRWGIFTGYALNVRIIRNQTSYSAIEHGIYVSNSADNPYIHGNHAHHNRASGIQINADPALPGDGIIHTGTRGSIEIDPSSRPGFVSDYNVVNNRFSLNDTFITLARWRGYGYDLHSILNPGLPTLFVNPTAANYHLKTGSPAINTGVTVTGVIDDIDGNPRPQGLRYDIGADEVLVP